MYPVNEDPGGLVCITAELRGVTNYVVRISETNFYVLHLGDYSIRYDSSEQEFETVTPIQGIADLLVIQCGLQPKAVAIESVQEYPLETDFDYQVVAI